MKKILFLFLFLFLISVSETNADILNYKLNFNFSFFGNAYPSSPLKIDIPEINSYFNFTTNDENGVSVNVKIYQTQDNISIHTYNPTNNKVQNVSLFFNLIPLIKNDTEFYIDFSETEKGILCIGSNVFSYIFSFYNFSNNEREIYKLRMWDNYLLENNVCHFKLENTSCSDRKKLTLNPSAEFKTCNMSFSNGNLYLLGFESLSQNRFDRRLTIYNFTMSEYIYPTETENISIYITNPYVCENDTIKVNYSNNEYLYNLNNPKLKYNCDFINTTTTTTNYFGLDFPNIEEKRLISDFGYENDCNYTYQYNNYYNSYLMFINTSKCLSSIYKDFQKLNSDYFEINLILNFDNTNLYFGFGNQTNFYQAIYFNYIPSTKKYEVWVWNSTINNIQFKQYLDKNTFEKYNRLKIFFDSNNNRFKVCLNDYDFSKCTEFFESYNFQNNELSKLYISPYYASTGEENKEMVILGAYIHYYQDNPDLYLNEYPDADNLYNFSCSYNYVDVKDYTDVSENYKNVFVLLYDDNVLKTSAQKILKLYPQSSLYCSVKLNETNISQETKEKLNVVSRTAKIFFYRLPCIFLSIVAKKINFNSFDICILIKPFFLLVLYTLIGMFFISNSLINGILKLHFTNLIFSLLILVFVTIFGLYLDTNYKVIFSIMAAYSVVSIHNIMQGVIQNED